MSLSLGLTKGFDIISFMTDLFETTTSIRKLSKKYGVDSMKLCPLENGSTCQVCSSKHLDIYKTMSGMFFVKCFGCGYESPLVDTAQLAKVIWLP